MQAIVSVPPDMVLSTEATVRIRELVSAWVANPVKPLVLTDGLSVNVYDDDWHLLAISPVTELESSVGTIHDWYDWAVLVLVALILVGVGILLYRSA